MNPTQPNRAATSIDFEFGALAEAKNYRNALIEEFGDFVRGNVIEIGAGIGQITELIRQREEVNRLVAIEPDRSFAAKHRMIHPGHVVVEGFINDAPAGIAWDAIVSVNVLEHVEQDSAELEKYSALLSQARGYLCLFVPAGPEIYAPIDRDFGHFRRYQKAQLKQMLVASKFEIVRLDYFNFAGYFAWWFNFCLLKKRTFETAKVRLYDRVIFPGVHRLEVKICRPPFGQSLIAVARAFS